MEKMTSFFTRICLVMMFVLGAGLISAAQAQNAVSGTVKDSQGSPLPGVAVMVQGTTNGTVSDFEGKYQLSNVPADGTLVFSFIGFETQTVAVAGQKSIDASLVEESIDLNEIVAVGYGTMKKSDISGSVASVDRETMMKRVPQNVGQALQGAAAGVMVTQQDGSPDAKAAVRIRGVGTINGDASPLYVVDGVQVGTSADFVNPSDIQSIEVLKDASATAIYGSAGANGVIMITTNSGSKGVSNINVTADFGLQTLPYKLDVLGLDTYTSALREAKKFDNEGAFTNKVWNAQYDGKRNEIDWQDEMLRVGKRQQYGVSVNGGNDKSHYNLSFGYLDVNGMVINTSYQRFTTHASVTSKVNKYLEVGGDVNYVYSQSKGSNLALGNNQNLSSLRDFASLTPTLDYVDGNADGGKIVNVNLVNPDGTYGAGFQQTDNNWEGNTNMGSNPYAMQMENGDRARNGYNRVQTTGFVDLIFLDNNIHKLDFRSQATFTYTGNNSSDFTGGRERYNYIDGKLTQLNLYNDQTYAFSLNGSSYYSLGMQNYLTYNLKLENQNLQVMVGNEVGKTWGEWLSSSARKFASVDNRNFSLAEDMNSIKGNGGYNADTRNISYFARAMYSLMDRYVLTATIRKDGSSNFSEGNRWGTFPSVAAAWRVSEEGFMQNQDIISNLKLRLGWGQTGNAGGVSGKGFESLSGDGAYSFYPENGISGAWGNRDRETGFYKPLVDVNLKWETTEMTNIGVDVSFLEDWDLTADYFIKKTTDLLLYRQIRPTAGYSQIYTNYGEIENTGLEISLGYHKQINSDFSINVRLNASTLKNKVNKMGDPIYSTCSDNNGAGNYDGSQVGAVDGNGFWNNHSICKEGEAVGSYYGFLTDGIIRNDAELKEYKEKISDSMSKCDENNPLKVGDMKFKDLNGDKTIDDNDRVILGNGLPKLNYGLNIGANYKNFDFTMYLYGVIGQDILSYSAMKLSSMAKFDDQTIPNILKDSYDEAFRDGKGSLPALSTKDYNRNYRVSDMWVKKGDFLRISNLQVGYTLPKEISKSILVEKARVYVGVNNLATISGYNKYGDPECGAGSVLFSGLDTGRYPQARTFMAGLSITF